MFDLIVQSVTMSELKKEQEKNLLKAIRSELVLLELMGVLSTHLEKILIINL